MIKIARKPGTQTVKFRGDDGHPYEIVASFDNCRGLRIMVFGFTEDTPPCFEVVKIHHDTGERELLGRRYDWDLAVAWAENEFDRRHQEMSDAL